MQFTISVRGLRRQVILWANPVAFQDGYTVYAKLINGEPGGQFAFAPLYVTDKNLNWVGTWSANQIATPLTNSELQIIAQHQTPDGSNTLKQKMNWLMNGGDGGWGSPLKATYPDSEHWLDAQNIKMVCAIYAGQWIEPIGEFNFTVKFNGVWQTIPMVEIRTFPSHEWDRPSAWQEVTAVDAGNEFNYPPVGHVKLPIYFGERRVFVFKRWLENQ